MLYRSVCGGNVVSNEDGENDSSECGVRRHILWRFVIRNIKFKTFTSYRLQYHSFAAQRPKGRAAIDGVQTETSEEVSVGHAKLRRYVVSTNTDVSSQQRTTVVLRSNN